VRGLGFRPRRGRERETRVIKDTAGPAVTRYWANNNQLVLQKRVYEK